MKARGAKREKFQENCLEALRYFDSSKRTTAIPASLLNIAIKIGSNRLAVYSALEALKRKGKVGSFRSRSDMWGVLLWYEIKGDSA